MKLLLKEDLLKLSKRERVDYFKNYLNKKVEMFIGGTSPLSPQNVKLKAEAVSELLFFKISEMAIREKISFLSLVEKMLKNAYMKYSTNKIMDYSAFFLEAVGYKSINNKIEEKALDAWESIQEFLPWMKNSTNYESKDVVLISTLARMKVVTIERVQEAKDGRNRINSWNLTELKKRFLKYYAEYEISGEVLVLPIKSGYIKELTGSNTVIKQQITSKTRAHRAEFNKNVDNIAKGLMGGWDERMEKRRS